MAHTDLLIFFNTAFWVFFLFVIIYLFILVLFSSNTYFRVRIFSIHRVFLMTCLLSFFQLGLVLSKMLHYFSIFSKNLLIFSFNFDILNNYVYSIRGFIGSNSNILILQKSKYLITTFFKFYS